MIASSRTILGAQGRLATLRRGVPNQVLLLTLLQNIWPHKFCAGYATDVKRSWLWKTKIYVWQFRSCVQFRCKWQAIIREDSRLQNSSL